MMNRLLLIFYIVFLTGCSSMGVEPWERDLLAKDSMQPVPHYFDNYFDEHIYFSKEASSGGQGVGGGGCGCN
ncbi:putative lipoprotein [hydrothermal vent metagenome]|uniref:Putative lipoprotein n=1 Tax=hydrothermal vent metagenome TaxID=652676 RepID=A0A3B0WDP4_9ZZZZ